MSQRCAPATSSLEDSKAASSSTSLQLTDGKKGDNKEGPTVVVEPSTLLHSAAVLKKAAAQLRVSANRAHYSAAVLTKMADDMRATAERDLSWFTRARRRLLQYSFGAA